ncbi:Hypothetical protein A7982_06394 [Minicystis rosea]|nr:Hypothetical protein A7982_06394 [Minicystis rosea]
MSTRDPKPIFRVTAISFALAAAALLGACDTLLRVGQPDRFIDPHVSCADGPCVCVGGFDDCDGDEDNGCETDLSSSASHCGACGSSCDNGTCSGGVCTCAEGFVDCDGNASNGCEARLDIDLQNCGACDHDCGGSVCSAGVCLPVTFGGLDAVSSIATGNGDLYVARCGDPAVGSIDASGGSLQGIGMATGCASMIAVSDDTVVWATTDAVLSASLDFPASATELTTMTSPVRFLAASPTHIYWWSSDTTTSALVRVPIAGGAVETVAETTVSALAVGAELAYWSDAKGIHAVRFDGLLVSDLSTMTARALSVEGDTLFAADAEGIHAITSNGTTTLLEPTEGAEAIAADTAHVYWVDTTDNTVRRIRRDATEMTILAKGEPFSTVVAPIALDDDAVYWIADQKVRRVAK